MEECAVLEDVNMVRSEAQTEALICIAKFRLGARGAFEIYFSGLLSMPSNGLCKPVAIAP